MTLLELASGERNLGVFIKLTQPSTAIRSPPASCIVELMVGCKRIFLNLRFQQSRIKTCCHYEIHPFRHSRGFSSSVFHSLCFTEEVVVKLQNNCVADDVACSLTFENAASILFLIATALASKLRSLHAAWLLLQYQHA
jgi:hypothetical protein